MKTIGLTIVSLVLCMNGFAQTTYTERAPFSGVFSGACSTEQVAVSGILETNILVVFNGNNGVIQFHTKDGPGTSGVGMTSGINYAVKINEFSKFMYDLSLRDVTFKQTMTLKGAGPDNDLKIGYFVRLASDGTVFHTTFEKIVVDCR